jgi:hypothetical protein
MENLVRRLAAAEAAQATNAINGLNAQITLQQQLIDKKAQAAQFSQDVGVLTGAIVGFNGDTPIYAKDSTSGQYQYQSAQAAANQSVASSSNSSDGYINQNIFPSSINAPFFGPMATGTNRMPADGYVFAHKDEAIVPAKYNPAAGGNGSGAPVTIQGGITITMPNVTNQTSASELARQILPELKRYAAMSL